MGEPQQYPAVGFIGAGRMGLPMVRRLAGAGFDVVAVGRRAETTAALRELGVTVLAAPAAVGAAAQVLCVMTFDDAQIREVLLGTPGSGGALGAMRPGSTLVIHSTCGPDLVNVLQKAAPAGVSVLDAPVSGRAPDILAGRITLLVGGEEQHLDAVRPVLAAYGDPILHLGPLGSGQRTKLLNNLLFAVNMRLAGDVAVLSERLGLDPVPTMRAIAASSGASYALNAVAEFGGPAAALERVREFLDKDVNFVQGLAADLGVDLGRLGEIAEYWHPGPQPALLAARPGQKRLRRTRLTEWSGPLCRTRLALARVGWMFSTRLTSLMVAQMLVPKACTSASLASASWWNGDRGSVNAVSRSLCSRLRYHCRI
jgi:3-hydroxyisobutyrate dehydrogenase-like beta-hydroxyacid dehydrogenase